MKTYYVRTEQTCPQCNGEIAIRNSAWNAVDEYTSALPDMSSRQRDQAIESFCAKHFGTANPRLWPPEDRICPTCDGASIIVREEDITELIVALQSLPETIARMTRRIKELEEDSVPSIAETIAARHDAARYSR